MAIDKAVVITTEEVKKDEHLLLHSYPDPLSPLGKALGHLGILRVGNGEPVPAHLQGLSGAPWTIGYGRARGIEPGMKISLEKAEQWLHEDIVESLLVCQKKLNLPWDKLSPERQSVLINMCYNMGERTLRTFKNTLQLIREGKYVEAGNALEQSKWYKQVGKRAKRLVLRLKTGVM